MARSVVEPAFPLRPPRYPRRLMTAQMSGFQLCQTRSASSCISPATTSATGPNTSGMHSTARCLAGHSIWTRRHHGRLDRKNDASDPHLSRRAGLDSRVKRAVRQIPAAKDLLRFRNCNNLSVTRYVFGTGDLVGPLHQSLRVVANERGKRHLPLVDRGRRELDAALHHRCVDGRPVTVKSVRFCNHSTGPITIKQFFNEVCGSYGPLQVGEARCKATALRPTLLMIVVIHK